MNQRLDNGSAIEARGLVKQYGEEVLAVDGVDLSIPANRIYGLLGPNGAGKTTTIKMLTGLLKKTSGRASILGFDLDRDPVEIKRRIGVVPAWLADPSIVTSHHLMPTMPSTSVMPRWRAQAPCSSCCPT